ncbi:MAG: rhodanese-like domain-containing protein [Saprospiraceae bacterium]|nr:rhodanese-like domain-containing protein [Saprospiraceae bacterium]
MKNNNNGTVIDVREPFELTFGKFEDAINIPMGEIPGSLIRLEKLPRPLIFICASGNRSGQVVQYLQGIGWTDVHNGGGWKMFKARKAA